MRHTVFGGRPAEVEEGDGLTAHGCEGLTGELGVFSAATLIEVFLLFWNVHWVITLSAFSHQLIVKQSFLRFPYSTE